MNTVKSVKIAKTGNGKRGPWALHVLTLDNGQEATGFDSVREGGTVETFEKDGKTNYKVISQGNGNGSAPAQTNGSNGNGNYSADRSARIERQHSQEMALMLAGIDNRTIMDGDKLDTKKLRELISWFQRDVANSPAKAQPEPEPVLAATEEGFPDL